MSVTYVEVIIICIVYKLIYAPVAFINILSDYTLSGCMACKLAWLNGYANPLHRTRSESTNRDLEPNLQIRPSLHLGLHGPRGLPVPDLLFLSTYLPLLLSFPPGFIHTDYKFLPF